MYASSVLPDDCRRSPQPISFFVAHIKEVRPFMVYDQDKSSPTLSAYKLNGAVITTGDGENGSTIVIESYDAVLEAIKDATR